MNKEENKQRLVDINKKIDYLEKELSNLKAESDQITMNLINSELSNETLEIISNKDDSELDVLENGILDYDSKSSNDDRTELDVLEKQILDYDTRRRSFFVAKAIDAKGIKLFASLNDMNDEDEKDIKEIIDKLLIKLVSANVDEGYISSLAAAKECSYIVHGLSTFTMVIIVGEKTYAFAEGKSDIYTFADGELKKFDLVNKYSELNYDVLNNDDYSKLVLVSKCDRQDFSDEKVKIITSKTDKEELYKELNK